MADRSSPPCRPGGWVSMGNGSSRSVHELERRLARPPVSGSFSDIGLDSGREDR